MAAGATGVNGRPVQNRVVEEHKRGQDLALTLLLHTVEIAAVETQRSLNSATNKHVQWTAGGLSGPNGQDAVQHAEVEHDQEDVPVPIHHRPMTDQDVLADTWRLKGATHNRVQWMANFLHGLHGNNAARRVEEELKPGHGSVIVPLPLRVGSPVLEIPSRLECVAPTSVQLMVAGQIGQVGPPVAGHAVAEHSQEDVSATARNRPTEESFVLATIQRQGNA